MSLAPSLALRQAQTLAMTPQLQQAIKLLALSNLEIEAFLAEEVEKNPLLVSGAEEGEAAPRPEAAPEAGADELVRDGAATDDAPLDPGFSSETMDFDRGGGVGTGEDGIDFDQFAGAADSLHDHLLTQAGQALAGSDLVIAGQLIDAIDDAGYLTEPDADIAERLGIPLTEVQRVLAVVQTFDPVGVGARGLAECLALQAREADRYDPCMAALIANLELLALGRVAHLQRLCGVDDEDMADMIRELRGYDPKPGLRFGATRVDSVVPDVLVQRTKAGWRVELNPATLPRVLVDRRYQAELRAGATDKAARTWLREASASANWLLKALEQRQQTIIRVATEIVRQQEGFFREGVAALRPLTLRHVAEVVGLHESTISRVTSNKFLNCTRGTFELKYFFGSGVATDAGEGASATAVKAAIRALIMAEQPDAVLSDDALVDLLKAQGFDLARRTVAKYREAIGLGSSVQRRRAAAVNAKAA